MILIKDLTFKRYQIINFFNNSQIINNWINNWINNKFHNKFHNNFYSNNNNKIYHQ